MSGQNVTTNTFMMPKLTLPTQGTTGKIVQTNKFLPKGTLIPFLGYVGTKCDNKHISAEIDVPYSGHN